MKKTFLLLFVLITYLSYSQENEEINNFSALNKERSVYIKLSSGLGISSYRDQATSPLFQSGIVLTSNLSRLRTDTFKESEIDVGYFSGIFVSLYNDHFTSSTGYGLSGYYTLMYQILKNTRKDINIKIGGTVESLFFVRNNESLMNNAVGYEWLPTLYASAKVRKDISRKHVIIKDFLLFKLKLKPRRKSLDFKLNIGLVNSSMRNGHAYLGQSVIINDFELFDDYQFELFSGMRINSTLDYTIYLHNKNAIQCSYYWQAATADNGFGLLEMAFHVLKFSFLFNTK